MPPVFSPSFPWTRRRMWSQAGSEHADEDTILGGQWDQRNLDPWISWNRTSGHPGPNRPTSKLLCKRLTSILFEPQDSWVSVSAATLYSLPSKLVKPARKTVQDKFQGPKNRLAIGSTFKMGEGNIHEHRRTHALTDIKWGKSRAHLCQVTAGPGLQPTNQEEKF